MDGMSYREECEKLYIENKEMKEIIEQIKELLKKLDKNEN